MSVQRRVLLISNSHEPHWRQVLAAALNSLVILEFEIEARAIERAMQGCYDMFLVDATFIDDVRQFVSRMRHEWPKARFVVITAAPTWTRAREAFRTGAVDYIQRSMDPQYLRQTFVCILARLERL